MRDNNHCASYLISHNVVSGPRHGIDEDFAFLGRYTAYVCNCLPTFQDSLIFTVQEIQDCSTVEDGTDRLHQNRR